MSVTGCIFYSSFRVFWENHPFKEEDIYLDIVDYVKSRRKVDSCYSRFLIQITHTDDSVEEFYRGCFVVYPLGDFFATFDKRQLGSDESVSAFAECRRYDIDGKAFETRPNAKNIRIYPKDARDEILRGIGIGEIVRDYLDIWKYREIPSSPLEHLPCKRKRTVEALIPFSSNFL